MSNRTVLTAVLLTFGIAAGGLFLFWKDFEGGRRGGKGPNAGDPSFNVLETGSGGSREVAGAFPGGSASPAEGQRSSGDNQGNPPAGGSREGTGDGAAQDSADKGSAELPTKDTETASSGSGPTAVPPLGPGSSTLTIRVTGPEGTALSSVPVEIQGAGGSRSIATDGTGAAEMAKIPAGAYEIHIRPPGIPALRSSQPVAVGEGEQVEVRCQVPAFDGGISGKVLDGEGNPVAGIRIDARPIAIPGTGAGFVPVAPPEGSPSASSAEDGTFDFTGLPRIEHILSTRQTSSHPSARIIALAGSAEPVEIILLSRRTIHVLGKVLDSQDAPLPGAQVSSLTHAGRQVLADGEGGFDLELEYERGSVAIAARLIGYAQREAVIGAPDLLDQDAVEVTLRLEPTGKTGELSGRIMDAEGVPIASQMVHLHSPTLGSTSQGTSGQDGAYAIRDIRVAPDYRVWVNPTRAYKDFAQAPVAIEEGASQLDILLQPLETGRIAGIMVDPEGRPVPRLTLWVRSISASANVVPATGNDQGRFTVEDAPAGDLYFETRASPLVSVRGIRLEPGESKDVELLVGLGRASLSGKVAGPGGAAVAGARIVLTWSGSRGAIQSTVFRESTTDASGRFSFSGLCRGRGSLTVSAPGHQEWRENREFSGRDEEVQVDLKSR